MTDAALNKAIALEVMGWEFHEAVTYETPGGWYSSDHRFRRNEAWSPATDSGTAIDDVVERMIALGWRSFTVNRDPRFDGHWFVAFDKLVPTSERWDAMGTDTHPRAICEAALAAVRSQTQ